MLDDLSTGTRENLDGLDIEVAVGSILDQDLVGEVTAGAASIVHLAAVPSVPRSMRDPVRSHDVNATSPASSISATRGSPLRSPRSRRSVCSARCPTRSRREHSSGRQPQPRRSGWIRGPRRARPERPRWWGSSPGRPRRVGGRDQAQSWARSRASACSRWVDWSPGRACPWPQCSCCTPRSSSSRLAAPDCATAP